MKKYVKNNSGRVGGWGTRRADVESTCGLKDKPLTLHYDTSLHQNTVKSRIYKAFQTG
jgi:hypothetical protein